TRPPRPAQAHPAAAPALLDRGGLPRHVRPRRPNEAQDPHGALVHAVGHPPEELRHVPGSVAGSARDGRGERHRHEQDHPRRRLLEAGARRSPRADPLVLPHPGRPDRRSRRRPARAVQVLQARPRKLALALRRESDATVHMSTLELGDVTVTSVIEIDRSSFPTASMLPDSTPDAIARHHHWLRPHFWDDRTGDLASRVGTYIVKTPRHTVLIDTGVGNDKPRDGSPAWHMRQGSYVDDLRAAGVTPGQ